MTDRGAKLLPCGTKAEPPSLHGAIAHKANRDFFLRGDTDNLLSTRQRRRTPVTSVRTLPQGDSWGRRRMRQSLTRMGQCAGAG